VHITISYNRQIHNMRVHAQVQRLEGTLSFTVIITEVNANSSFETRICSAFVNHDQHAAVITDSHNESHDV